MLTPISAKTTTWLLSIPTLLADCTTTIRPGGTVWVKIWTATIGTASENPMRLCSCDWAWVYADNQNNICGCVMDSGTWHVEVAKEGRYSLTLRQMAARVGTRYLRVSTGDAGGGWYNE